MKKALTIFGLILHIAYYIFAVLSLGDYEYKGYGVGKAFTFWLFAMIISLHCIFIYLINAIVCIVMSRKMFNILKLTLILCAFPLCVFVGCAAGVANSIIWNIYFAIIFVIQIISLFVKNEAKQ